MKRLVSGIILTTVIVAANAAYAAPANVPAVKAAPVAKPAAVAVKLLDGTNDSPRWIDANSLLITRSTDVSKTDYKIQVKTKQFELALPEGIAAASLVVSPDGKMAAYQNEEGQVFTVELATKKTVQVSDDKSIKDEFQWSKDGKKLYFLQGDKANVIASIDLADGKVTKLVEDKVDYKSDLNVSLDGTKFYYLVSKGGKLEADSIAEGADEKAVEAANMKLDLSGTEAQVYSFNTKESEPKAVKLTDTADNKVLVNLLPDGRVVYISADAEKAEQGVQLKIVSEEGKEAKTLVGDLNVLYSQVVDGGKIVILGADQAGKKAIYEVDANTAAKKKVADVAANATQIFVSHDGKQIAVALSTENGDTYAVLSGNKLEPITK